MCVHCASVSISISIWNYKFRKESHILLPYSYNRCRKRSKLAFILCFAIFFLDFSPQTRICDPIIRNIYIFFIVYFDRIWTIIEFRKTGTARYFWNYRIKNVYHGSIGSNWQCCYFVCFVIHIIYIHIYKL